MARQDEMRDLLASGSVFVVFDSRHPQVILPEYLLGQRSVTVEVGYDMPIPIHDLTVSAYGVRATLQFRGLQRACFVPWEAVIKLKPGSIRASTGRRPRLRLIQGGMA